MDKIKVGFVEFWPNFELENIFLPILQKYFDVEITNNEPDFVIHSIYGAMKEVPKFKCKKILYLAENYRASNYESDYSISFDPHTETNYSLPLWQFYCILNPEVKQQLFGPRPQHKSFDRFCAFTVSNGGNVLRNLAFQSLNSYKRVNSYGNLFTNDFELKKLSEGRHWRAPKFEFFKKYTHKYMITFENTSYPYYCTEKIMDAFVFGSVPIYWGDPKVNTNFNKNAFINAMSTSNWVDVVKTTDTNEEEYLKIYNESIFTDEQKERHLKNIEQFETWLINTIYKIL